MSTSEVTVVDYGLGNLFNVKLALESLGASVKVTSDGAEILRAGMVVLPGVGAFGEGMRNLRDRGLVEPLREVASSGRPMLGICLGMQLFMTESEEHGLHQGLNLIEGRVVRFDDCRDSTPKYKVPHVGWNSLSVTPKSGSHLADLPSDPHVYFVHSYYVVPKDGALASATTTYGGQPFCSAIKAGNVQGCQFHPERSGHVGLQILGSFLKS